MKVLLPLLSKQENNAEFLQQAAKGAKEIVLLLVVDTDAMLGMFGFAASEIGIGSALMQSVKQQFGQMHKKCDDIIEWGDTLTKIAHIAKLRGADKIVLLRQDNQFFKKLLKELKEKIDIEIEGIKI